MSNINTFLTSEEKIKRTPVQRGHWTGERGNSRFYSDNPRMKELGAEYIEYVDGEPDFSQCCKYRIEIPSMTNDRLSYSGDFLSNYQQAYLVLSENLGISEKDVKNLLKEEKLTLHECYDMKTICVLPMEIHKTYTHAGGVAECKAILDDEEDDELIELIERGGYGYR